MATELASRPKVLVFGSLGLSLLAVGIFVVVAVRRSEPPESVNSSRPASKATSERPPERVAEKRQDLIQELVRALEGAATHPDRKKMAELEEGLVREGDAAIPVLVENLKKSHVWNFRIAILEVLSHLRSQSSVRALEGFYGTLASTDKALKIETIRRLGRMGGAFPREALARILGNEADEAVRGEIGKALVALGLTSQEVAKLGKRDREILEGQVKAKDEQRAKITALEKSDPKSDAGLSELKKAALEEPTVAIALLSFQKLVERGDAQAVEVLTTRIKAPAETNDARIIQTNALASLTQIRVNEGRLAVRDFALGKDPGLRVQTVELLGGYGDRAMLPLLDQAALLDKSDRMVQAVERARVLIESRARAEESGKK